jgi:hypothetical protein
VPEHRRLGGRLPSGAPLIAGHVSLQTGTRPTRPTADRGVIIGVTLSAGAANAKLGPGYRDSVVASFQG